MFAFIDMLQTPPLLCGRNLTGFDNQCCVTAQPDYGLLDLVRPDNRKRYRGYVELAPAYRPLWL